MAEIWGLAAVAAATVAGSVISSNASSNAASTMAKAGQASQVNLPQLESQAIDFSNQNAAASNSLQNQYTPWVQPLQQTANTALTNSIAPTPGLTNATNYLGGQVGSSLSTPTLNSAIQTAQNQLNLGGTLDQATQNAVTRQSLATAGGVTPGGLGQGGAITARDLGLTSLQLQQQRLNTALGAGQAQQGLAQANVNNNLNNISALSGVVNGNFNRAATASQIGNSIAAPASGLNPGSLATIATGNANNTSGYLSNQANITGQAGQNLGSTIGTLGGIGMSAYNNYANGLGAQTVYTPEISYADFLAANPTSSAATGLDPTRIIK